MAISRREFMARLGATYIGLTLPGCASFPGLGGKEEESLESFLGQVGPIRRGAPSQFGRVFSGDSFHVPHQEFLRSDRKVASEAKAPEQTRVLVIGGGVAGLTTAYLLRDLNPILLEQGTRLGGNSQGEAWQGIDYSIGAAYFSEPEEKTRLYQLLINDLKVNEFCTLKREEDPVLLRGRLVFDFAKGTTDPPRFVQFQKLTQILKSFQSGQRPFPQIPERNSEARKKLSFLDRGSLHAFLEENLGAKLSPDLLTSVEHFCWSAFGASATEISAAAGLNFMASEMGGIYVANGGNSAVTERIATRLTHDLGIPRLRTNALVTSIQVEAKGARVEYRTPEGKRTLWAETVVFCGPKFIAQRLVPDFEKERLAAISRMNYRSYLLGNFLVNKDLGQRFFDLFLLQDGKSDPRRSEIRKAGIATDVVSADYAKPVAGASVLTVYRPLPYDGARVALLDDQAYERFRQEFESQFFREIAGPLGIQRSEVVDVRLTRWGHPLPVAKQGYLREGLPEKVSAPFRERLFFAQQDNWLLPCLETAMEEAMHAVSQVRAKLGVIS